MVFQGRHFQLEDVSLGLRPIQPTGIPLWIADSVAKQRSPAFFATQWEQIQGFAHEMSQDVQALPRCVSTPLHVNSDVPQAQREVQACMENYSGAPYETLSRQQGACAGTAAICASWLNGFVAAGAQMLVVRFGGPDQFGQ